MTASCIKNLPGDIQAIGDASLLSKPKLGFFCSVRCPGALIIEAYDFIQKICLTDIVVIGGFHSPIEKECLRILVKRKKSMIICPARSLKKMRIRSEYREPLDEGRLLFISSFSGNERRPTTQMSLNRNHFAASMADSILIVHAEPSSKTEQLARDIISSKKMVFTFHSDANSNLIGMGAKPVNPDDMVKHLSQRGGTEDAEEKGDMLNA